MHKASTRLRDRAFAGAPSPATAPATDRWAFQAMLVVLIFLSICHTYYVVASRMVPSTDEAHYMSGVISIVDGVRSGTLAGAWTGYRNALVFKPPLVCLPAAFVMLLTGGVVLPCMLSLVLTFFVLGLASYSLFRHCLRPFHAAVATVLLLSMPMITGLTHRFYVELLLVLLCVVYLDILARGPWRKAASSALMGAVLGLGVLCKVTFPAIIALPTLYSLWAVVRGRTRSAAVLARLGANLLLSAFVALLVALPWYEKNWEVVLEHARLASTAAGCYYPHWILADISTGPWIVVFIAAAAGFLIVMMRLWKGEYAETVRDAWIQMLLLGIITAILSTLTVNKATRLTATWLPMLAALAVVACRALESRRLFRHASAILAAASVVIAIHNSFGILPLGAVRLGDVRIIDTRFPLNIPGWFDDNHPLDRRDFRLAEAEEIVARDARTHLAPGQTAEARTTTLSLQLSHDYFQMLSQAHKTPVHYTWWPGSSAVDGSAPDYILGFEGFDRAYPGVEYHNHYPALKEDVDTARIPYHVLSHLQGPAGTGIWIYARKRLESRGGPHAGDLVIEAESFQRGTVKVETGAGGYGQNIGVIVTPQAPAYAEYDFKAPATGEYQIEFRYASAAPRPLMLLVDGAVVNRAAAGSITGGFYPENQHWEPAGVVKLAKGEHTMRIQSEAVFPHIDRILLSPTQAAPHAK